MNLSAESTNNANRVPAPRRHLAWWKKLLFSLGLTTLFILALELTLALVGVRPILYEDDPYVGFASTIPLFVEQPDSDGTLKMVTAENRLNLFNRQSFVEEKRPGVRRIFCLGGSTTYGRPYDDSTSFAGWLRELLREADPDQQWEVINAGGISYASYRVAMLMDELVQYEPDLFIVYSGHNEFLEQRTYQAVLDTSPVMRNIQAQLHGLRSYSLMKRMIKGDNATTNLGVDSRDLLPAEVDAILDRSIGPDDYYRDDQLSKQVISHYQYSLQRMIATAKSAGVKIVLVTPASNLKDFSPFKSEHSTVIDTIDRDRWYGYFHQAGQAVNEKDYERALQFLDQAARLDDRHARLQFLRGRMLMHLERFAEAKSAFVRARDEDICPLRALSSMRTVVLQTASQHEVPAVDFVNLVEQRSENGIPGNELFLDHVHPSIDGHRMLALSLVDEMKSLGLISPPEAWNDHTIAEVTRRVKGRLNSLDHANAMRNLAKVLGWAGRFEEASKLALRAVEGLPDDANAHLLAGKAHWQNGEKAKALEEYELALEISPDYVKALLDISALLLEMKQTDRAIKFARHAVHVEPDNTDARYQLGLALVDAKDDTAALREFEHVIRLGGTSDALREKASILNRQGDKSAAVIHLEQVVEMEPGDVAAHVMLGGLYADLSSLEAAADQYTMALLLDPICASAYAGLGDLKRIENDFDAAREYYRQALEFDEDDQTARDGMKRLARPQPSEIEP